MFEFLHNLLNLIKLFTQTKFYSTLTLCDFQLKDKQLKCPMMLLFGSEDCRGIPVRLSYPGLFPECHALIAASVSGSNVTIRFHTGR